MINIPKGTKDVLPFDSYKWQYAEKKAREICRLFAFREIRTPVFEHTELFTRSIGDDTDVVKKEMYTFLDKGNRSITLKPEGTAPVARSFVENSLDACSLPLKMYYITPVFRYENPQAGRLREHHQFGVEVYGGDNALLDYEVISLAHRFLSEMGVTGLVLNLNSIGCEKCRGEYNKALKAYLASKLGEMCGTCRERFERNPLRILDCKVEGCKNIVAGAPKIIDYICDDCRSHMSELEGLLKDGGIDYVINSNIVRGLDYYPTTVFEFVTTALGSQGTVCGGGRYNHLVESVGGKPTPCVGFGLGLERLLMLLDALGVKIEDDSRPDVFVISQSGEYVAECMRIVKALRSGGISAETDYTGRSLKAQFRYADKLRARYAMVIGSSEAESGVAEIKRLDDGTAEKISISDTVNYILEKRKCQSF